MLEVLKGNVAVVGVEYLCVCEREREREREREAVLVCPGCHNKIPQTGGLKQQEFIFSQFWRLQV